MNKKSKQIRELGIPELKVKVEELKKDYAKEIVKSKTGAKNEKAVNMKNLRKNIARVLTILTEKEYAALNQPLSLKKKVDVSQRKAVVKTTEKTASKDEVKKAKK